MGTRLSNCERTLRMSFCLEPGDPGPVETARVARGAFPKDHACLRLRDE